MSSLFAAALAAVGAAVLFTWAPRTVPNDSDGDGERDDPPSMAVLASVRPLVPIVRSIPSTDLAAGAGIAAAITALSLWCSIPVALAVALGLGAAGAPTARRRRRVRAAQRAAAAGWPRLLDDLRVRTGALGRPIPQALLEVGARGPVELRTAFAAASREWALSTDVARMLGVLKERLRDPIADAVCETLLVAHEVGGDVDARLAALAADCRTDLHHRAEADARQAGARVARWFVLIVPAGMALAGLRLGDGAAAFGSPGAQLAVVVAAAMVAGCWWWAGQIMTLPTRPRVFER